MENPPVEFHSNKLNYVYKQFDYLAKSFEESFEVRFVPEEDIQHVN